MPILCLIFASLFLSSNILYAAGVEKKTFYIQGVSGRIGKVEDGKVSYFINDHLGSPRVVVDKQGQKEAEYDYHPFGETIPSSSNQDTETRTFTGKEFDEEIELYYFNTRYYNPGLGRFISPDPAGQYASPYIYCANNPLGRVDISGSFSARVFAAKALAKIPIVVNPDSLLCNWVGGYEYSIGRAESLGFIMYPGPREKIPTFVPQGLIEEGVTAYKQYVYGNTAQGIENYGLAIATQGMNVVGNVDALAFLAQAGDEAAFNELVTEISPKLDSMLARYLPESARDDVRQDVLLSAWQSLGRFKGNSAFKTWFHRITMNKITDYHRKAGLTAYPMLTDDFSYVPGSVPSTPDLDLDGLIGGLPKSYREIFKMYREGFGFSEISEKTGLTYDTVRYRYQKGLNILRQRVQP